MDFHATKNYLKHIFNLDTPGDKLRFYSAIGAIIFVASYALVANYSSEQSNSASRETVKTVEDGNPHYNQTSRIEEMVRGE